MSRPLVEAIKSNPLILEDIIGIIDERIAEKENLLHGNSGDLLERIGNLIGANSTVVALDNIKLKFRNLAK